MLAVAGLLLLVIILIIVVVATIPGFLLKPVVEVNYIPVIHINCGKKFRILLS